MDVVNVLDIGHGSSTVIRTDKQVIVIDAGPGSGLLEFLKENSITSIDLFLVSHADNDHIKGILPLLSENIEIKAIYLNTDSLKGTDIWDDVTFELDRENRKGKVSFSPSLTTNETGRFDRDHIRIEILAPSPYIASKGPGSIDRDKRKITSNTISAVIRVHGNKGPVAIFMGDIDETGVINMAKDFKDIKTPILIFPHHGGKLCAGDNNPVINQLLDLCDPSIIIFSTGRGRFDTPRPETVATIRKKKPKIRIMCTELSEHCAIKLISIIPVHLTPYYAEGKTKNGCCSGTIAFSLEDPIGSIQPEYKAHRVFIDRYKDTALCVKAEA